MGWFSFQWVGCETGVPRHVRGPDRAACSVCRGALLAQPQGEGRSRPNWERGISGPAGSVPRVLPPEGGEIHVWSDRRAVATDHLLERGASEVQHGASEVGGEVRLRAPAPPRGRGDAVERV